MTKTLNTINNHGNNQTKPIPRLKHRWHAAHCKCTGLNYLNWCKFYREENLRINVTKKIYTRLFVAWLWSTVTWALHPLPRVLKDVSIGSESPPRLSHAAPSQPSASPFCQSADGSNRQIITQTATRRINVYNGSAVVGSGGWSSICRPQRHWTLQTSAKRRRGTTRIPWEGT